MSNIDESTSRGASVAPVTSPDAEPRPVLLPLAGRPAPRGVTAADYDRTAITPGIVHMGFGGFHRAHQAAYLHALMQRGEASDWGIVGVNVLERDAPMHETMTAQGGEYVLVERRPGDDDTAQVVGSVVRHHFAPTAGDEVLKQLVDPAVRIVSLTVTESGYEQDTVTGEFTPTSAEVLADLAGVRPPRSALGLIVEALRRRQAAGVPSFTVLSCDNVPHNGHVARRSLIGFASRLDPAVADHIADDVAFPSSMVDRITPVTTDADRAEVRDVWGIDDAWPVVSESWTQWVIEDDFPTGRPPLELVGVQFVDDVAPYEEMKLRLLNAGHQALAQPAALLGLEHVHGAARDPLLGPFLTAYLSEARPTVDQSVDVDLDEYCITLTTRFGNDAIADTIDRIIHDTDSRLAAFLVPPTLDNRAAGRDAPCAALIFACALSRSAPDTTGRDAWHDMVTSSSALGALTLDRDFVSSVVDRLEQIQREGATATLLATLATASAAGSRADTDTEGQHHA